MLKVLSFPHQPSPIKTLVAHQNVGETTITAITRVWEDGDYQKCSLCPSCQIRESPPSNGERGECLILVNRRIHPSEAPLFEAEHLTGEENDDVAAYAG